MKKGRSLIILTNLINLILNAFFRQQAGAIALLLLDLKLNECFQLVKDAYIVGAKKFSFTDHPSGKL